MDTLEKYMKEHNLTLKKLASIVGWQSSATVCQHLSGARKITAEAALKYSHALGIPLSDLRPDLWPPAAENSAAADGQDAACPENEAKSCLKSAQK